MPKVPSLVPMVVLPSKHLHPDSVFPMTDCLRKRDEGQFADDSVHHAGANKTWRAAALQIHSVTKYW